MVACLYSAEQLQPYPVGGNMVTTDLHQDVCIEKQNVTTDCNVHPGYFLFSHFAAEADQVHGSTCHSGISMLQGETFASLFHHNLQYNIFSPTEIAVNVN